MIQYPFLQAKTKNKQYTVTFGGLNETENYSEGEFCKTKNLSVDSYPAVSQRATVAEAATAAFLQFPVGQTDNTRIITLGEAEGLWYVTSYYLSATYPTVYRFVWEHTEARGGSVITQPLTMDVTAQPTAAARIQDSLAVFPNGVVMKDTGNEFISVSFTASGIYYGWFSATPVSEPSAMVKRYYGIGIPDAGEWASYPFTEGDTLKITNTENPVGAMLGKTFTVRGNAYGYTPLTSGGMNIILTDENIFGDEITGQPSYSISFSRECPTIEMCCEWNNRIWGVNTSGNTIYASALGDPKNFYRYNGTETDSWTVDVGSEGRFTAIAAYGSSLLVFKEKCIHRIYGSTPSTFSVTTINAPGVQKFSQNSVCIIKGILYYKGTDGIYAYDGSYPVKVSGKLTGEYTDATAGTDGERYYVSMTHKKDGTSTHELLCYDTRYGTWVRENETAAIGFAQFAGVLFYVDATDNRLIEYSEQITDYYKFKLKAIYRNRIAFPYLQDIPEDASFEWSGTLCPITETVKDEKKYSRLWLRAELTEPGCYIRAEFSCDGKPYEEAGVEAYNERKPVVEIPIRPDRCDSLTIRISGKGRVNIRGIIREVAV